MFAPPLASFQRATKRRRDLIPDSNVRACELQEQRREIEIEESLEFVVAVDESDFEFNVIDKTELFGFIGIRHNSQAVCQSVYQSVCFFRRIKAQPERLRGCSLEGSFLAKKPNDAVDGGTYR